MHEYKRGNLEDEGTDRVDPITIDCEKQDVFPRTDLIGGYIGDGVPLYVDLLAKMLLRRASRILYHLLNYFS